MRIVLFPVAARVLGSLVEKEITTPEYYPLSLNALTNACNQKKNREPVMNLDEDDIRQALHRLEDDGGRGRCAAPKAGWPSMSTICRRFLILRAVKLRLFAFCCCGARRIRGAARKNRTDAPFRRIE